MDLIIYVYICAAFCNEIVAVPVPNLIEISSLETVTLINDTIPSFTQSNLVTNEGPTDIDNKDSLPITETISYSDTNVDTESQTILSNTVKTTNNIADDFHLSSTLSHDISTGTNESQIYNPISSKTNPNTDNESKVSNQMSFFADKILNTDFDHTFTSTETELEIYTDKIRSESNQTLNSPYNTDTQIPSKSAEHNLTTDYKIQSQNKDNVTSYDSHINQTKSTIDQISTKINANISFVPQTYNQSTDTYTSIGLTTNQIQNRSLNDTNSPDNLYLIARAEIRVIDPIPLPDYNQSATNSFQNLTDSNVLSFLNPLKKFIEPVIHKFKTNTSYVNETIKLHAPIAMDLASSQYQDATFPDEKITYGNSSAAILLRNLTSLNDINGANMEQYSNIMKKLHVLYPNLDIKTISDTYYYM